MLRILISGRKVVQEVGVLLMFCLTLKGKKTLMKVMLVGEERMGSLHITRGTRENPLNDVLVSAAQEAGFLATEDYNGFQQEGFGPADRTIWKGSRWSAAKAYLKPSIQTKKLKYLRMLLLIK